MHDRSTMSRTILEILATKLFKASIRIQVSRELH